MEKYAHVYLNQKLEHYILVILGMLAFSYQTSKLPCKKYDHFHSN